MAHEPTNNEQSISHWLCTLQGGQLEAAEQLWRRYAERVAAVARRQLSNASLTSADEDDVTQSVFRNICRGAAAGRFANVRNRDELWWLLLKITKEKAIDYVRREHAQKRGGGRVRLETDLGAHRVDFPAFGLDDLLADDPTPEYMLLLQEEASRLLQVLRDDRLRQIALWRIEGLTLAEIADQLAITVRSVDRKIRLIRRRWAEQLEADRRR